MPICSHASGAAPRSTQSTIAVSTSVRTGPFPALAMIHAGQQEEAHGLLRLRFAYRRLHRIVIRPSHRRRGDRAVPQDELAAASREGRRHRQGGAYRECESGEGAGRRRLRGEPSGSLSGERFAAMQAVEQVILTASENGYGKRTSSFDHRVTRRGGKDIVAMAVNDRNGLLVASFPAEETRHRQRPADRASQCQGFGSPDARRRASSCSTLPRGSAWCRSTELARRRARNSPAFRLAERATPPGGSCKGRVPAPPRASKPSCGPGSKLDGEAEATGLQGAHRGGSGGLRRYLQRARLRCGPWGLPQASNLYDVDGTPIYA